MSAWLSQAAARAVTVADGPVAAEVFDEIGWPTAGEFAEMDRVLDRVAARQGKAEPGRDAALTRCRSGHRRSSSMTPARFSLPVGAIRGSGRCTTDRWDGGMTPLIRRRCGVQAWRNGTRQANLARRPKSSELVALDGITARAAGQLCGRASTSDVTDAVVAVVASGGTTLPVTAGPDDLAHLLAHAPGGDGVQILTV